MRRRGGATPGGSDILFAAERENERKERFARPVYSAMATRLNTIQLREPLKALLPVFERNEVAPVMEGPSSWTWITRIDLINTCGARSSETGWGWRASAGLKNDVSERGKRHL